jgi:hypothetical protein
MISYNTKTGIGSNLAAVQLSNSTAPAGQLRSFPPTPTDNHGRIELRRKHPMFLPTNIADSGQVVLGGQAPMFLPEAIADSGIVRLGGQSPAF